MSDYNFGTVNSFSAAVTVPPSEALDPFIRAAYSKALEVSHEWGRATPHRMAVFRIHESWNLEERGGTWVITYTIKLRVVTVDESITLPGAWNYQPNVGLSE